MKIAITQNLWIRFTQIALLAIVTITLLSGQLWAYGERSGGRRGGPPQEAIDACVDKEAGDIVEFEGRRGDTIKGTCTEKDGQLIAIPEGKGQRRRGGEMTSLIERSNITKKTPPHQ